MAMGGCGADDGPRGARTTRTLPCPQALRDAPRTNTANLLPGSMVGEPNSGCTTVTRHGGDVVQTKDNSLTVSIPPAP